MINEIQAVNQGVCDLVYSIQPREVQGMKLLSKSPREILDYIEASFTDDSETFFSVTFPIDSETCCGLFSLKYHENYHSYRFYVSSDSDPVQTINNVVELKNVYISTASRGLGLCHKIVECAKNKASIAGRSVLTAGVQSDYTSIGRPLFLTQERIECWPDKDNTRFSCDNYPEYPMISPTDTIVNLCSLAMQRTLEKHQFTMYGIDPVDGSPRYMLPALLYNL